MFYDFPSISINLWFKYLIYCFSSQASAGGVDVAKHALRVLTYLGLSVGQVQSGFSICAQLQRLATPSTILET